MDAQLSVLLAHKESWMKGESSGHQEALRVLLVSTCDYGGGAEHTAWNVYKTLGARGHKAWLAVGDKRSDEQNVLLIPNDSSRNTWAKAWLRLSYGISRTLGHIRGVGSLQSGLRFIGEP